MVIFLDTGYIMALRNKDDQFHKKAMQTFQEEIIKGKYGRIIVSDYVYDEIMTLITRRIKEKEFIKKTKEFLLNTRRINLLFLSEEIFMETTDLIIKYFDQQLSFTDCTFLSLFNKFSHQSFFVATFDENLSKLVPNVVEFI